MFILTMRQKYLFPAQLIVFWGILSPTGLLRVSDPPYHFANAIILIVLFSILRYEGAFLMNAWFRAA